MQVIQLGSQGSTTSSTSISFLQTAGQAPSKAGRRAGKGEYPAVLHTYLKTTACYCYRGYQSTKFGDSSSISLHSWGMLSMGKPDVLDLHRLQPRLPNVSLSQSSTRNIFYHDTIVFVNFMEQFSDSCMKSTGLFCFLIKARTSAKGVFQRESD